jgi:hypothetical protein
MSFQKDLPPPGIYDGACAIVKRNPSPCIWKPLCLISAEERHQQTCNLGCDHRPNHVARLIVNANDGIIALEIEPAED